MPKQVDHEARRTQIAEALLRLASRGGLEAVSLRDVAAEAGISMGAVQHYFKSKEQMLLHAMDHVTKRAGERIVAALSQQGERPSARKIVRTVMLEMLALTDDSRMEFLTHLAFFMRALGSPELAAMYREWWPELERWLTGELRTAQESGELPPGLDPAREAEILLSIPDGLSVGLLLGHRTGEEAIATIDYHLDRLFGGHRS
ncbi:transcriptional regulator, TetR family [Saccharopolyspora kobensis]|uniref:Transcriptional regulator, TetR family n=1 Tax=Saccharopolyspora kobensis TaxID=146035 RepID=A0A1H6DZR4_9PSEU|nr:TetR family transcriptional regulator C-terminal domain-containing protein [Saccharopolyspora kobensis]SEG90333.1 transcriptional regulator, TetR family [Saccharopolyspora kobensis]SFD90657.1 transcriptional regulator, TetR family [Saccharopolyspora kobensis]